ncbi:hypothetical protein ACFL6S_20235 [Candidatus Poribacteria bacterium]
MRIRAILSVLLLLLIGVVPSFGQVVINEVLYDPPGSDTECFVELMGEPGLGLDDYSLVGVNGDGGNKYNLIDLSGHRISQDGYFVVAQSQNVPKADLIDSKVNFQNGPDSIQLWRGDEKIDSVGYGDFSAASFAGEGKPTLDLSGYSIGRRPDGIDTDNNSVDFVGLALASPGERNGPATAVSRTWKLVSVWGCIKKAR